MVVLSRVADDTSSGVQNSLELVGEGLGCTGENSVDIYKGTEKRCKIRLYQGVLVSKASNIYRITKTHLLRASDGAMSPLKLVQFGPGIQETSPDNIALLKIKRRKIEKLSII